MSSKKKIYNKIGELDFTTPKIMGILNVTPDSFFDGGQYSKLDKAIKHARKMIDDGADWIDIGGESTRPGSTPVSVAEELDRVIPVIQALNQEFDIPLSIDTSDAEVMSEAIKYGVSLVNDVYALRKKDSMQVVSDTGVNCCLLHMSGEPGTMQNTYFYDDVVADVKHWLTDRVQAAIDAGIDKSSIVIDPGFGFGKSDQHNLALVRHLMEFKELGVPILVGLSRKSTIGRLLQRELADRLPGTIALGVIAILNGANILRVHDVTETVDAIKILTATIFEQVI